MRVERFFQIGDTGLAHEKSSPYIDAMHQIPSLGLGVLRRRKIDGARIIDQDIDTPEGGHRRLHDMTDTVLIPDIPLDSQYLPGARCVDLGSRGMDRPFQLG